MDGILKAFRKAAPEFIFKAMIHEPRHLEVMAYSDMASKNALQIYQNFLKNICQEYDAVPYDDNYNVVFKKDYVCVDTWVFLNNPLPNGDRTISITGIFATGKISSLASTYGSVYFCTMFVQDN